MQQLQWDEKTNANKFYGYTRFSDNTILGEPITKQEYFNELWW